MTSDIILHPLTGETIEEWIARWTKAFRFAHPASSSKTTAPTAELLMYLVAQAQSLAATPMAQADIAITTFYRKVLDQLTLPRDDR